MVPAQTPAADVLAMKPDGVFLSNGPGDPAACDYAIAATREFLGRARCRCSASASATRSWAWRSARKTLKMKFGHHGANHPVKDHDDGRVLITSQNHGFAVDPATLAGECAGHAHVAVRRLAAGFRADRPPGVLLPGSSGGQPGPRTTSATCSIDLPH